MELVTQNIMRFRLREAFKSLGVAVALLVGVFLCLKYGLIASQLSTLLLQAAVIGAIIFTRKFILKLFGIKHIVRYVILFFLFGLDKYVVSLWHQIQQIF